LIPGDRFQTALAWLNPSVTVLTASQAARLIAKIKIAAILNIGVPDIGAATAEPIPA
jgi:hypothetical protein